MFLFWKSFPAEHYISNSQIKFSPFFISLFIFCFAATVPYGQVHEYVLAICEFNVWFDKASAS